MTVRSLPGTANLWRAVSAAAIVVALYLTSRYHYLLFHSLAEIACVVVAVGMFMVAWNAREYTNEGFLLFLGIAYLFVALVDLLHTLSYAGMGIFPPADYATELWIGGRMLEAASLLAAFLFIEPTRRFRPWAVFAGYGVVTALLFASVFWWRVFPECYIEGVGLTPFKKTAEYVLVVLFLSTAVLLYRYRDRFERSVYLRVFASLVLTAAAEIAFTFYIDAYGFSNLVGHFCKLASFYLLHEAIVRTGIKTPYRLIFRELDRSNRRLSAEVEERRKTEAQNERVIRELRDALAEINVLRGILPICMHCKRIRDDEGYWDDLDRYVRKHSEAEFSHGLCPECLKEHYGRVAGDEEE